MSRTKRLHAARFSRRLDLPFGNMVNDAAPNVPLAELMAIDFAAHDLSPVSRHAPLVTRRRLVPIRICSGLPRKARSAMQSSMGRSPKTRSSQRGNVYLAEQPLAAGIPRRRGGLTHVSIHTKNLQYPVRIARIRTRRLPRSIISQYGGPNGELGASLRYLSQRFAMPSDEVKGILTDIGTEELGHLEMVGSIVHQLTRNLTPEENQGAGL